MKHRPRAMTSWTTQPARHTERRWPAWVNSTGKLRSVPAMNEGAASSSAITEAWQTTASWSVRRRAEQFRIVLVSECARAGGRWKSKRGIVGCSSDVRQCQRTRRESDRHGGGESCGVGSGVPEGCRLMRGGGERALAAEGWTFPCSGLLGMGLVKAARRGRGGLHSKFSVKRLHHYTQARVHVQPAELPHRVNAGRVRRSRCFS